MDIVEKLRRQADADEAAGTLYSHVIAREAADEIERLRRPGHILVPVEPTTDMLYAMAECDGYQRGDRDHPMLTRWEDYWRMALSVLMPSSESEPHPAEELSEQSMYEAAGGLRAWK